MLRTWQIAVIKELRDVATREDCFVSLLCLRAFSVGPDASPWFVYPNIGRAGVLCEDMKRNPEYYEHDDFWNGEFPCYY